MVYKYIVIGWVRAYDIATTNGVVVGWYTELTEAMSVAGISKKNGSYAHTAVAKVL